MHEHTPIREAQNVSKSWYGYLQHSVMFIVWIFLFLVSSTSFWTLLVISTMLVALIALLVVSTSLREKKKEVFKSIENI